MFTKKDALLIAVSGGLDSVVLCHLCFAAGYKFSIAHCNFSLRGEESDRDEAFVRSLAKAYNAPLFFKRFNTKQFALEHKISTQEAARELRYSWFAQIIKGEEGDEKGSFLGTTSKAKSYLLTAHHADDNIETLLMNFFKGTGISGLHGILPKQNGIVRPLLFAERKEIAAYAKENNLAWVEDSSNSETKYTRNYFRHTILPQIEKVYPEVKLNLRKNIERFAEIELLYKQSVETHTSKLVTQKGKEWFIPVLKLTKSKPLKTIIYEIIKPFNFTARQVDEVEKLLYSQSGKYITSATHRILRNRAWLIISTIQINEQQIKLVEKGDSEIVFDNKALLKKLMPASEAKITADPNIALLDAGELSFPLQLRRWMPGDYFYPLGMRKKKKLSRFFIDKKISIPDKENVWVIESAKKIVWIVGHRIDDRFKVTGATKKVVQLTVTT